MPAAFERCRENGGKIRTKTLPDGKYMHICIPKGGGASIAGEVKTKKAESYSPGKKRKVLYRD